MELSGVQLGLKHMRNFKIKQVRSAKKMRFSAKNGAISEKNCSNQSQPVCKDHQ